MLIVFGSLNTDISFRISHHPVPGETLPSDSYEISGGGKGANQALAAARAGAKTALAACAGDDTLGRRALSFLKRNGVMTSGVVKSDKRTGLASIAVSPDGENFIILAGGANEDISNEQVPDEILTEKNILLLQNEVPPEESLKLLKRAADRPVRVILNLAPFSAELLPGLSCIDLLVMNETEARQTATALDIKSTEDAYAEIARDLSDKYNIDVILTLGAEGSVLATRNGEAMKVPALGVEDTIDTTGAGDAFCGTLAACLHAGKSLEIAMKYGSAAGSLSCTKKGAQDSFPYLGDIEEALLQLES